MHTTFANDLHALEIILTAACNLRCAYCYQNDKQSRRMTWDVLLPALDLILGSRRDRVRLLFIGGEPLLEMPLIRRAVEHTRQKRRRGQRISFHISTNGLLVDDDIIAFFAEHDFDTQVSFDGVAAAQDFRGRGTFAELDALLDHLRDDFPDFFRSNFHVALTLHSGNLSFLADSIEYFIGKGVREVQIAPLITHDSSWRYEDIHRLDQQFARIFDASLAHYRLTGEVPLQIFQKGERQTDHCTANDGAICAAGQGTKIAVDVDGRVTGCVMFAESYQRWTTDLLKATLEPMQMGKVRSVDFRRRLALYPQAARAGALFHDKASKYSSYSKCGTCVYLDECGICPTSSGHIPGNSDPHRLPDMACAYNLTALKYRALFPAQPDILDLVTEGTSLPVLIQEILSSGGA